MNDPLQPQRQDPRQPQPVIPARPAPNPQQPHAYPQQVPGTHAPVRPAMMPQHSAQPHAVPQPAHPQHAGPARIAGMPTLAPGIPAGDDGAIELIEDGEEAVALHKKIKAFGNDGPVRQTKWNRQPTAGGTGAVRVKTFHAKLSDQGLDYLDDAINTFVDQHPEVNIKFVTTNVGMFDGKFKDFALMVNVWY